MFPSLSHIKEFYYTISIINYMICLFFLQTYVNLKEYDNTLYGNIENLKVE